VSWQIGGNGRLVPILGMTGCHALLDYDKLSSPKLSNFSILALIAQHASIDPLEAVGLVRGIAAHLRGC